MNKTLKKILISGASLLMLAPVSASMNNVQSADASSRSDQISRLKHQKRYYTSKANHELNHINRELV